MIKKKKLIITSSGLFILLVLFISFAVIWNNGLRDRLLPKKWGVVEDGEIYRSGRINPALIEETLKKHGIKTIINLAGKDERFRQEDEISGKLGIKIYYYTLQTGGGFPAKDYAEVIERMLDSKKTGKPVLIHCAAGVNRTGAVVAVYRVLIQKKTPEEAYKELRLYGWNPHEDLIDHLNGNIKEISELLVKNGAMDKIPEPLPRFSMK